MSVVDSTPRGGRRHPQRLNLDRVPMASLPTVALIGNPNTGKSTLFNQLTGGNARVGNYPGITVERLSGTARIGERDVEVVDVPGCYSLAARSPDERVAIDAVLGRRGLQRPALLVLVVDATNLERNLYLALQLQELELPFIIALNQMDVFIKGIIFHLLNLG